MQSLRHQIAYCNFRAFCRIREARLWIAATTAMPSIFGWFKLAMIAGAGEALL